MSYQSKTLSRPRPDKAIPILILALSGFALVTTEFLIIGLIPMLSQDLEITVSEAGYLVSLFAFTVMICGPWLTSRLAHLERRSLFAVILFTFAASNLLAAVAPNVWVLAVARFIPALALPVFWGTASETASGLANEGQSGRAVGQVYLGISAALVLGVPLGTLAASTVGWRGSFAILSVISLILGILTLLLMPKLSGASKQDQGSPSVSRLLSVDFLLHVLLSIIVFSAMFTAYTYLADFLQTVAKVEQHQVGWWLMGFGLFGLLGNWLGSVAADRSPLGATTAFTFLLAVAMFFATPASANQWLLIPVLALWGIAYTALFPICQIRVMKSRADAKAVAATVNVSAANAGAGLGALAGGFVINIWDLTSLAYVSALIASIAIFIALAMWRHR